jgi:hypothetical protein
MKTTTLSFPMHTQLLAFGLELAAVATYGVWAWHSTSGVLRVPLTIAFPLAIATAWGTFATAGAQVSGKTVVATPGPVRLVLELVVLGGAAWALFDLGAKTPAAFYSAVLVLQLLMTRDRLWWLAGH